MQIPGESGLSACLQRRRRNTKSACQPKHGPGTPLANFQTGFLSSSWLQWSVGALVVHPSNRQPQWCARSTGALTSTYKRCLYMLLRLPLLF